MCDFPYFNNNNTCILFSEYDYNNYNNTRVAFTTINILGMIASLLLCFYTYIENERIFKLRQKLILGIFMSFFLLFFQFMDPFGYNGWMPYLGDVLLSNLSAWLSLSILYVLLYLFTKIYNRFRYTSIDSIPFVVSFFLTLIITLMCSFLQVFNDRFIWRGIKLLFIATYITILTTHINVTFYKVINLFHDDFDRKKKLYLVLILFNIIMPIIVISQYYLGLDLLINRKYFIPKIDWKMLILPSSHIVANMVGLFYFRGKPKIYLKDMLYIIKERLKLCIKKTPNSNESFEMTIEDGIDETANDI